ncbi:GSCOCG00008070001-RA-CDS, partial [Cotesia congregata]
MKRREKSTDDEDESEVDEESESEESAASYKKYYFLGIPVYKLSYKRLPKKCLRVSFFTINAAVFYIVCHSLSLCVIFICSVMSTSVFERITTKIREEMTATIIKYQSLDWVTEAWDNTQQYLKCCGIKSYKDWGEYMMEIPQSCCSKLIERV